MSKTVAIIQARLGSQRLPAKVFRTIAGRRMIDWVVDRVSRSQLIDEVVVATTDRAEDHALIEYCRSSGWKYSCGPEMDVLQRFLLAAAEHRADRIVRITSDCPLIDPQVVDQVIARHAAAEDVDYTCNFWPLRTFPRGLDCEVIEHHALQRAAGLARDDAACREHVTLAIYRNPQRFKIASVEGTEDFSEMRWTVDTAEDLSLVQEIAQHFTDDQFGWRQIIGAYLRHPRWLEINRHVLQKAA